MSYIGMGRAFNSRFAPNPTYTQRYRGTTIFPQGPQLRDGNYYLGGQQPCSCGLGYQRAANTFATFSGIAGLTTALSNGFCNVWNTVKNKGTIGTGTNSMGLIGGNYMGGYGMGYGGYGMGMGGYGAGMGGFGCYGMGGGFGSYGSGCYGYGCMGGMNDTAAALMGSAVLTGAATNGFCNVYSTVKSSQSQSNQQANQNGGQVQSSQLNALQTLYQGKFNISQSGGMLIATDNSGKQVATGTSVSDLNQKLSNYNGNASQA